MNKILLSIFLFAFLFTLNAQDSVSVSTIATRKIEKVRILFGINYGIFTPIVNENDLYAGESKATDENAVEWIDRKTNANLAKNYKANNTQFELQANIWKGLFFGIDYTFFNIKKYKKEPNTGNLLSKKNSLFMIVAAKFGYTFEFLKNKNLQIEPSFKIGSYSADNYFDGIGKKIYVGFDCKTRYFIKNKFGFSLGLDYDYLRYKNNGYSDIFNKDTKQKTAFNNFGINVGLCYNINIKIKD